MAGALLASSAVAAAPISTSRAAMPPIADLTAVERSQFMYLGQPYCWYPYGWKGPGWYWCGYGTQAGVGWGGAYGWNGWVAPRSSRSIRQVPKYRFKRTS